MRFYALVFALLIPTVSFSQTEELNIHPDLIPQLDAQLAPFYHGVASGDPTQEAVIIWTRVTLPKKQEKATVRWEVATDIGFKNIIKKGNATTGTEDDFTVKVDVQGLSENTVYYYRFRHQGKTSVIGETHTLPAHPNQFSIAFTSCSNYEWGYFNAYRRIAEDEKISLVVHLGDYIYEYAPGVYGDTTIGRINVPAKEIISLDDYRTRYSLYRLDKDLKKVHQMKPFITTWDDHEIANNGYKDGAQNHQPEQEGDWYERKKAGTKAYYEWLPIRENSYKELYRSFKLGNLLSLVILDTRIAGRTEQVSKETDENYMDEDRTMLGKKQYDWFMKELENKSTAWKIIGNQVPFGPIYQVNRNMEKKKYMDGWDGYPYERNNIVNNIINNSLKDIVFVTGDYHRSFAFENDLEGTADTEDNSSVEFVVTSITSANDDEYVTRDTALLANKLYLQQNPHLKYVNNTDNGYLVLTVEKEKVTTDFYYVSTVKQSNATVRKGKTFVVEKGKSVLVEK